MSDSDFITFSASTFPSTARVLAFRGHEGISQLYQFDVFVVAPREDVEFELPDAVGTRGRLMLGEAGATPAVFAGILGDVEILHEFGEHVLLRAVLVPQLSELAHSTHSRIFTKQSAPDVIKAVLAEGGVTEVELRLGGAYEVEEHICQYRESDLDFISRWMEREGIFYYFEHTEDGEKLILSDAADHPPEPLGKPIRYAPGIVQEDWSRRGVFRSFAGRSRSLPATVKLRDYDYARPNIDISGAAPVSPSGSGEVSLYGERFFTSAAGQRLAKIRAEELLARESIFRGSGTVLYLSAGRTFELEDHPRASFNASYLVIEAHHHGNQAVGSEYFRKMLEVEHEELYFVELSAIPEKTQFRAASVTPWPRIYGYETGIIDAPATSEYAQIDSQGRYLVKFKFDESSLKDGNASTWVRMMQPHGGGVEGFHFPLRKGTEVVIAFLGGDADRPVISGVVPNALTPSPVTNGNYTKNIIQTGGRNRFELEDLAGQERVTLSTPHTNSYIRMGSPNADHNVILHTDGRTLHDTGTDLDIVAGGYKHEEIVGEVRESYHSTKNETVDGIVTEDYKSDKIETIAGTLTQTVTGAVTLTFKNTKTEKVTGAVKEEYEATKSEKVTGALTQEYKSTKDETVTGLVTEKYKAGQTIEVTGDRKETISGKYLITIGKDVEKEVKGAETKKVYGPYHKILDGENVTVVAGVKSATYFGAVNNNNFGLFNDNKFGGQISLFGGIFLDVALGARFFFQMGLNCFFTYGAFLDINTAVKLHHTPVGISTRALQFEIDELRAELDGIHCNVAGLIALI